MSALDDESTALVKEEIRRCIMATDMGHHKDVMEEFQASESELLGETHTASDFFSNGEKGMLLLGMLLKACDISNPARPPEIPDKWVGLVYEEFYAEGDADKAAGRSVNPLHDRATNNIPESQVGFIGYACGPLFAELVKFCAAAGEGTDAPGIKPEAVQAIADSLAANSHLYAGKTEKGEQWAR